MREPVLTETTGYDYLAAALASYGVSHVFMVPTVVVPSFAALDRLGVRTVTAHAEKAAAYMADGYARLSGRPGVCVAQGIGSTNLLAGLRDAWMASSPLIALTGGPGAAARDRHLYQDADRLSSYDALTKSNTALGDISRLPDTLRQAFRTATSGAPGPVHIELEGVVGESLAGPLHWDPAASPRVEDRYRSVPPFRPAADPGDVRAAADVLRASQRPVIVAGGGARISGAGPAVAELARLIPAPVATSLTAKGLVDETDPHVAGVVGASSREPANRILARADTVLFVGSRCGSQVTDGWRLPAPGAARILQIDIDPEELGRNYPNDVSLLGDARTVVQQLADELQQRTKADAGPWVAGAQNAVTTWRARVAPIQLSPDVPIRPERLCRALTDALPADAVLVADTGHAGIWAASMIDLRPPQSFLRSAGSLGWAFPAALGAKCAAGDRPVVCFTGDGGFYYHLSELETARRCGISIVVVVNDNRSFSQDFKVFDRAYAGRQSDQGRSMWWFDGTDLAQVARQFGWQAERIEQPGDIEESVRAATAAGGPVLLDVVTDPMALPEPPFGGHDFYAESEVSAGDRR